MLFEALLLAAVFTRPMERVNSLDPIRAQSVYDSRVVQLLYATPLEIDYAARPYRLVPGLCELPEISADGLTYVFRMRGELSAADIVRQLERVRDKANVSPGAWTLDKVDTIEAQDGGRTLKIVLKERFHVFPWMMAMSYAATPGPNGEYTGPYRLKRWRKNHEMVFERSEKRKVKSEESGETVFDTVRYLVIDDVSTQWLMFLKGEVDMLGEVSRDNWDAVVNPEGELAPELVQAGVRLYGAPTMSVMYLGMNMRDPVLGGSRKLRQALSCAFDFKAWKKFLNGRVDPSSGPVPPGVDGRLETPFAYAYDLEKAKKLIAEAGYPDGIDPATGRRLVITLSIGRPGQDAREMGELVGSFFERIGVRLELRFHTWSAFMEAVNEGRVQLYMMGWVGDYPDAENFLQMFHSRNVSPGANHSNYVNPEFDAEYDAAMLAGSAEERNRHWLRCQEILRDDVPWIFMHHPRSYAIVRPRVSNYIPSDFPYGTEQYYEYLGD